MKRIFIIALLALLTLGSTLVSAQDKFLVRGRVIDKDGEPMFGVTVVETTEDDRFVNGGITDFNGGFQLEVTSSNAILKFSYIGYETVIEQIKGRSNVKVILKSSQVKLKDLVVKADTKTTGGLTSIPTRDVTGSRVSVDMESMQEVAATSAEEALQGQIAGVDIVMNSGDPGAGASITIRGMGTLGNSNPLFVIDGIAQDLKAGDDFDFGSADAEDIGELVSIPTQDIKTITVLKDAAETAVWGVQGANGVIQIETHQGKPGKTQFNASYKYRYNQQPELIPMLNGDEYVTFMLEQQFNPSLFYTPPTGLAQDITDPLFWNYFQNTDWNKEITRDARTDEYNFQVRGGGEKTRYYASVNLTDEEGTTINTSLQRLTNRINLDYFISNKLTLTTKFSYANSYKEDNYAIPDGSNDGRTIREMSYIKAPNMSINELDEFGNPTGEFFSPINSFQGNGVSYYNPVAMGLFGQNDTEENQIQSNFNLKYRMNNAITAEALISWQYASTKINQFLPHTAIGANWLNANNNVASESDKDYRQLMGRFKVIYAKTFGEDHSLNGTFLYEVKDKNISVQYLSQKTTPSTSLTDPSSAAIYKSMSSGTSVERNMGAFAQLHYKFKDKYLFMINMRTDGSTKFGKEQRWGTFPSGSFAWRFGKEGFMSSVRKWIEPESKFRFSYGMSGNDNIGTYDRHATYGTPSGPNYYINNSILVPQQIQLDNVRWEKVTQLSVATDLFLFNNWVDITAEYYERTTSDLKQEDYALPSSSGFSSLKAFNGGEITNSGVEFSANVYALKSKNQKLKFNFNISRNRNRYNSLTPNETTINTEEAANNTYIARVVLGQPVGSFYGHVFEGVYPTDEDAYAQDANGNVIYDMNGEPLRMSFNQGSGFFYGGDAIYKDINNDGSIDILDAVYLGNSNPIFMGGFGVSYTYQDFTVSTQFHSRIGHDIINETAMSTQNMYNRNNHSNAVLRRWRRPGMDYDNLLPRAYAWHQFNNLGSSRYVEDGTYLRLNNFSVIYNVPKLYTKRMGMNTLKLALNGRKLYTWTNYSGQDPEVNAGVGKFAMGRDNAKTPPPMVLSFSVNLGF